MSEHPFELVLVPEEHSSLVGANEFLVFSFEQEVLFHAIHWSLSNQQRQDVSDITPEFIGLVETEYPGLFVVSTLCLEIALVEDSSDLLVGHFLQHKLGHFCFVEFGKSQHRRKLVCSELPDLAILVLQQS